MADDSNQTSDLKSNRSGKFYPNMRGSGTFYLNMKIGKYYPQMRSGTFIII